MIRKVFHILILFVFTTNSSCAQSEYSTVDIGEEIEYRLLPPVLIEGESPDTYTLEDRMAHLRIPGISIAVINGGVLEWAGGFGVLTAGNNEPVTASTLFQAASMSKPVAATAVLYLSEEGTVDLDEDVNGYLTSWILPANRHTESVPVTLRRLLNHTAGVNVHGFPGYPASQEKLPELREILEGSGSVNTGPIRVQSMPGSQWRYSGGGYTIIQQVIEDVTNKSFSDVMHELVLEPLEMTNSTYTQPLPKVMEREAASGHTNGDSPVTGGWHQYPEQAAAGLWTTPTDVARWIIDKQQTLQNSNGEILSAETVKEMFTPNMGGWGLGPDIAGRGSSLNFSHSGSNEGFSCFMTGFAETGQGIIIMTNSDNGSRLVMEILRTAAYHFDWPDYKPASRSVAEVDTQVLQNYTGLFQLATGMPLEISISGKGLEIKIPGQQKLIFLPSSETTFFDTTSEIEISFSSSDEDKAEELKLIFGSREIIGNRVE
jgi:CubicO group peptidase (beta-lactamase class C family)